MRLTSRTTYYLGALLLALVLLPLAPASSHTTHSATDSRAHSVAAKPQRASRPTVVLVHGADAESSSWLGVIERLQKRGYPVIAFANPLRGVASDSANLKALVDSIPGPVVLVGHSYGGMLISVAAAGDPKVRSLVYVDAQIPLPGENAAELTNKFPGSKFGDALVKRPFVLPDGSTGTDLYVAQSKYRSLFTGYRVSKREALALAAVQRPIAESALTEPASAAAWKTIPSWDVIGTKDTAIPPASQYFMAHRAHAHITAIPAPHASMLSFPGPIARVIEAAARHSQHTS
jgi:pimeloyl-ACP methyl ester carboxylesterase